MADEVSAQDLPASKNVSELLGNIKQEVTELENQMTSQVKQQLENIMADTIMTPTMPMMMGGGGDGVFGTGGGLIGGLILGSLLRNNGNLFGGGGDAAVAGATLRNPPEQNQANMSLMAAVGAVDKSVAVSTAAMEASQATQTLGITSQLNNITSSLAARVDGLKDIINSNSVALMQGQNAIQQNIMENRYELSRDIANDGDKTRALITAQYEADLNRRLGDANAQIVALQTRAENNAVARGVEVNTTNNINQMQQQQQYQQQFAQLGHYIALLGQQIRSNNEAINVGSGTLTANPTNTNTNIR